MSRLKSYLGLSLVVIYMLSGALVATAQEKSKAKAKDEDRGKDLVDNHLLEEINRAGDAGLVGGVMSIYASPEAEASFLAKHSDEAYILFPEHRENSIKVLDGLTQVWMDRAEEQLNSFTAKVQPGEYFTFQVGVYANSRNIKGLTVNYSELEGKSSIPIEDITCFNTEGVDQWGKSMDMKVDVAQGDVQPIWIGVKIPKDAAGTYKGVVDLKGFNTKRKSISITLNVEGDVVDNMGYNDGDRLSRMDWLNSTIGQDNSVTKGFTPIVRKGDSFSYLGREVALDSSGFPLEINSFFGPNNHFLQKKGRAVLSKGISFIIEGSDGSTEVLESTGVFYKREVNSTIEWMSESRSDNFELSITAMAEFDGFMSYNVDVTALNDIEVNDIRLEIAMESEMSKYMMGIGREGGYTPDSWSWRWDVENKSQDAVWVGGVNGGVRLKLKGANYHRQLVNIYYEYNPLVKPKSWGNGERGGIDITSKSDGTLINAYSGSRSMRSGETLAFDFELLVTPFKLINREAQYNDRYYHSNSDVSSNYIAEADKAGANIINIHHKKDINPFINYPYLPENVPALTKFIEDAHAKDIRTKVYYTTRELTVNAPEIWAMRSLNGEVIFPGEGRDAKTVVNRDGPVQWLKDNFKDDFIPAWKNTFAEGPYKGRQDISVLTTPDSRLNNFYLEGLDWMCKNMELDGVYIDDSALDRVTMKRARKILDYNRPNGTIDLHSWNHFNGMAGYACCLNLYMDVLPYFDMIWIGEGRSYDRPEDYWLVEISGIPFGFTSQMLQGGGNRWRGMLFGITARLGWHAPTPEHIWNFWDKHNFTDKVMIGYWSSETPIVCENEGMEATVYRGENESIIAVANMTDSDQSGKLNIDFKALGLNPKRVEISIPAIPEFQEEGSFNPDSSITIEKRRGYVILIKKI